MINSWTATLSVNAGLALRTKGLCIWVDALHCDRVPDFSTLTPERQRFLFASDMFADPDVIFFSHCHPDHYSEKLCEKAISMYPKARIVLPEPRHEGQILLTGEEMILRAGRCLLTFHRLTHEGEQFRNVPNYAMMVEDEGEKMLVLADAAIAGDDLAGWIQGSQIDTLFAPFPWISLEKGRSFVLEKLKPETLVIYHLPLKEDDEYGYVKTARRAAGLIKGKCDVRLMTEAFQTEVL